MCRLDRIVINVSYYINFWKNPKAFISLLPSTAWPARSICPLKELISSATNNCETENLSEELASLDVHKAQYKIDIELG